MIPTSAYVGQMLYIFMFSVSIKYCYFSTSCIHNKLVQTIYNYCIHVLCHTSLSNCFLQIVHVSYLIWYQCTIDLFFMDWERPQGFIISTGMTSAPGGASPTSMATPVSIWRTFFVAKEWNKIQSVRKINHTLLLVLVLLLQEVGLF